MQRRSAQNTPYGAGGTVHATGGSAPRRRGAPGPERVAGSGGRRRLRQTLAGLGGALLDTYAPRQCLYCDLPSHTPDLICTVCLDELRRNTQPCPYCALPDCAGAPCPDCQRGGSPRFRVVAPFVYDAAIAFLLREWKYRRRRHLVSLAARLAREAGRPGAHDALWLATPLHWSRRLQRGFNQSEDLLQVLGPPEQPRGTGAGKPPRLQRIRPTPKQALASRDERRRNLAGAFRVQGAIEGRSVVLIDDVCTTGATAEAMAGSLARAGAGPVTLWCIARTPAP